MALMGAHTHLFSATADVLQGVDMELQSSLIEPESPTVTLKNGTRYSRKLVKNVMDNIHKLQTEISNGALLLYDLVTKCRSEDHEFFQNSQWHLAALGMLDGQGNVPASIKDIVLSAVTGEGLDIGFGSPYQN